MESIALKQTVVAEAARPRGRSVDRVPEWAIVPFLIILAYLPYGELVHDQLQYQLFGYAAEVTVVPTFLVFVLFALIGMFRKPILLIYMAIFIVLTATVLFMRYFWGLDLSMSDTLHQAVGLRYMILIPMYILVAGYVLQETPVRNTAATIIIVNGAIASFLGILYVAGIVTYRVVPEGSELEKLYYTGEVGRAAGLSAGVNVYSNFLALALLVACCFYRRSVAFRVGAIGLIVLGILTSQSRWPLISAVLIIGYALLPHEGSRNKKKLLLVTICMMFALGGAYMLTPSSNTIVTGVKGRLSENIGEDLGVRQSKYAVGLSAIFENGYTAVAGASPETLIQGSKDDSIFSDNGVLSMFVDAGLPITFAFLFFCYRCLRKFTVHERTLVAYLFWFIAGGVLFFNNAIYWDSWLFHAAVVCLLLMKPDGIERGDVSLKLKRGSPLRFDRPATQTSSNIYRIQA